MLGLQYTPGVRSFTSINAGPPIHGREEGVADVPHGHTDTLAFHKCLSYTVGTKLQAVEVALKIVRGKLAYCAAVLHVNHCNSVFIVLLQFCIYI